MTEITVHLPEEIAHYAGDLRYFMDSMVRKLYVSRHKGFGEGVTVSQLLKLAEAELQELYSAIAKEPQMNAYFEAVDTANMFFLVGLVLTRMTKTQYRELQNVGSEDPISEDG